MAAQNRGVLYTMQTSLIILNNPFNFNEREQKFINLDSEISLPEFLLEYAPIDSEFEYHVAINGRVFQPEEISINIVRPGDYVSVCPIVSGGGRGSNPLAILAGIALAVFSFGVVSPWVSGLVGGGTLGTIAGNIAAGLIMSVGGSLISNAFSPKLDINLANDAINDENRYGWGNLQNITQQGAIMPITYGTIRTAGQILNQYTSVDEENDDEYLYVLLSGGEGVIYNFSDIRINDNPISNYPDASYSLRYGTNSQSTISDFNKIHSSTGVNVTLNSDSEDRTLPGEWHIVELSGDSANSLCISLSFPNGLFAYKKDSPDPVRNWVLMEFEYRFKLTDTSAWSDWVPLTEHKVFESDTISVLPAIESGHTGRNRDGITIRPVVEGEGSNGNNININGRLAYGGWLIDSDEIGIKKKAFTRQLETYITASLYSNIQVRGRVYSKYHRDLNEYTVGDTIQWTIVDSILDTKMQHPGQALVGVKIKATDQLNGGMPTITWRQTRNYVWVYDGAWVQKDAQNPAWIIYDLCVRAKNLDGNIVVFGESPNRIDLAAFKSWAAWNDRTLNNRPALKMNLYIDESKSLWQWCNDIAASARGAVVLRGTKISCIFDAPSNPVQLFSMGNIVGGSFSGEFLPVEDRATAVEIAYNNEANNFEREQITVYADKYDDDDARQNPVSVELTGITDFERAYREGLYRLNQNKYLLRTITFTASVEAIACQVGDVILVQHDIPQWGQGGRILEIDTTSRILTLDNDVVLNPEKAYSILIREHDDGREQFLVQTGLGGTTNRIQLSPTSDLRDVQPYDVFALGEIDKVAKPFRVQEMSRTGDLYITLTCSEYIAELYTDATNIPVIQYSQPVNEIQNLDIIATGYYTQAGQWIPEIYASWSYLGQRPASYQVSWKYNNDTWQAIQNVSDTMAQCAVTGDPSTVYNVRVRALYHSSLPSEWKYASKQGLTLKPSRTPSAPTNLEVDGWFGFASLRWSMVADIDFDHIEIWEANEDNLANATHIGNTPASSYTRLLPTGGVVWYWVRAVNHTGAKSDFNSQAGTPCIISATDHETFITQLLRDNPYLVDVIGDLNERIDPLEIDITDIKEINLPQIDNRINNIDISTLNIKNITIPDIQRQIEINADGIIQNALNHATEADERRNSIAIAKQELHAEITDTNEAIADYRLELLGKIEDNTGLIQREENLRISADEGLGSRIDTMAILVDNNATAITNEAEARASADTAFNRTISNLTTVINTNSDNIASNTAAISQEASTRASAVDALTYDISSMSTRVDDNQAAIQSEQTTRANADTALGQRIDTLKTTVDGNTAAIQSEASTRASADTALGSRIDTLTSTVDRNIAAIQTEQQVLSDKDTATAEQITTLQAQIKSNSDGVLQNASNQATEADERRTAIAQARQELHAEITETNEAVADYRLELLGKIGDNTAAIRQEASTRATETGANTRAISSLQNTVGGHTTSIQTLDDVKDGVTGRHYVKIDNNGYVVGTELYNGGQDQSVFAITADKFMIVPPNTTQPKQMCVYDTNSGLFAVPHIQVDNANIKDATIQRAKILHGEITTPVLAYNTGTQTFNTTANSEFFPAGFYVFINTVANTPLLIRYGALIYQQIVETSIKLYAFPASGSIKNVKETMVYITNDNFFRFEECYIFTPSYSDYTGFMVGFTTSSDVSSYKIAQCYISVVALYR